MAEEQLQIRDLDTGEVVTVDDYLSHPSQTSKIAISEDSNITLPPDFKFKLFKIDKNKFSFNEPAISQTLKPHNSRITCLVSSKPPEGSHTHYIATGDDNGEIVLYQFSGFLRVLRNFHGHRDQITALAFGSNDTLLSASMDKSVKLWHPSSSEELATFVPEDIVTCLAFNPVNPSVFAAGQFNNMVHIWDIAKNEIIKTVNFETFPTAVAFSPDGKKLAFGLVLGQCHIYSYPEVNYITKFLSAPRKKKKMMTNKKITSIVFNQQNQIFISSNDSRIRLYSLDNFNVIRKYVGHEDKERHNQVSLSPDEMFIMIPSETHGAIFIWPVDHENHFKGKLLSSFTHDRSSTCEGFKFGSTKTITGSVFTSQSIEEHLSVIVTDNEGFVYLVISK